MLNMKMPFEVPKQKQIRLIINADAKCEADDQYAIVHAVLSPRLQIKGIVGAHFGTRSATRVIDRRFMTTGHEEFQYEFFLRTE